MATLAIFLALAAILGPIAAYHHGVKAGSDLTLDAMAEAEQEGE